MADTDSFIPALYKPSSRLPIARYKENLQYTVETYPVTILIGQTGSGKTTQLPQYLYETGWANDGKVIAVTQASLTLPRFTRDAVVEVDELTATMGRLAQESGCYDRRETRGGGDAMSSRTGSGVFDPF